MKPFVRIFQGQAADQHAKTYVCGLLSNVERKNIESIAYRVGQSRLPLQSFIGWDAWDDAPLREELRSQVKTHLGQGDGVLVFDPSGFPKSGRESVGVARQWCGRLGKVDNCQVAISLGYVSRKGHTLVDTRLSLPKEWTKDTARLDKVGVPKTSRASRTRHQLALEMLAQNGAALPHRWMAGDDEMGRPSWFRRRLAGLGEQYLLAVPANTSMRDMEGELLASSGRGRHPQRSWQSVEAWSQALVRQAKLGVSCGVEVPTGEGLANHPYRVLRMCRRWKNTERIIRSVHREPWRPQGKAHVPEVWYSLVKAIKQTATVLTHRKPTQQHRFWRDAGGSVGVLRAWHAWREASRTWERGLCSNGAESRASAFSLVNK